jgi:hypothetical protein
VYFGDWQGRYSGNWFGDGAEQGQAAVPSLFAFWAGGNVGVEPTEVVSVGFSSLFAFWAGGNAGGNVGGAADVSRQQAQGGGPARRRRRRLEWPAEIEPERSFEDEEALLLGIV